MRKLSVALIGCGKIAKESHLPAYRYLRDSVSLSAVCDHNVRNAEKVSGEYGIKKVYTSLSEMLSGEHLDIIDICTPTQTHKAFTIQALEAGCNVLVEKPMAISSTDCDEMIQVSRNTGMRLCVVHNRRFHPSFLRAQEMIGHGEVGELLDVRMNDVARHAKYFVRDHWSNRQPKGPILEILPHQLYLCMALMKKVNSLSV
jgi:UDP-N-acetyl-2-amino-2-deoxyglucuronate dehydrogenase